jgi:hypothetical protein
MLAVHKIRKSKKHNAINYLYTVPLKHPKTWVELTRKKIHTGTSNKWAMWVQMYYVCSKLPSAHLPFQTIEVFFFNTGLVGICHILKGKCNPISYDITIIKSDHFRKPIGQWPQIAWYSWWFVADIPYYVHFHSRWPNHSPDLHA